RVHAPLMIASCVAAAYLGVPWVAGAAAVASFGALLVQLRSDWATEARTVLPNLVTAVRLVIVVTMGSLLHGSSGLYWAAAVGAIFALDYADGWVARRTKGTSAFG